MVARRDQVDPDALRTLAQSILRHDGVRVVVLGGSPDGTKVTIVAATGGTPDANQLVRTLGPMVGGGGGGSPEVATAGGKDPSGIEAALAEAQRLCRASNGGTSGRGPGRAPPRLDLGNARRNRRGLQRQPAQPGQPVGHHSAQR